MPEPTPFLTGAFIALTLCVAAAIVATFHLAFRRSGRPHPARRTARVASVLALWMALTGAAAAAGVLRFDAVPPTMLILLAIVIASSFSLGVSRLGREIADSVPLALLVGIHSFRFPLEVLMRRAAEEGIMPIQMSYAGRNFDVLTGIGAIAVAALLLSDRLDERATVIVVRIWNWCGVAFLVNILTVAILSAPLPIRVFHNEPANVWVTWFPFVWLPALLVATAIAGHTVIERRLRGMSRSASAGRRETSGVAAA